MRIPSYSANFSRESYRPSNLDLRNILEFLASEDFESMTKDGLITLGLIRPSLAESVSIPNVSDLHAADIIEESISNLGIATKFSFAFDEESVNEFYDGPPKYDSMMPAAPIRDLGAGNRWDEFKDMMMSGPSTALILYGPNAVQEWRNHLGHWNIVQYRDPMTIRGKFGLDNYNNLVHGSDSADAVLRETTIIMNLLRRQYNE